jgi:hypothetical protein
MHSSSLQTSREYKTPHLEQGVLVSRWSRYLKDDRRDLRGDGAGGAECGNELPHSGAFSVYRAESSGYLALLAGSFAGCFQCAPAIEAGRFAAVACPIPLQPREPHRIL